MTLSELPEIKQSLINIKAALKLNSQARQLIGEEFERQAGKFREHLEGQIGDVFDPELSRKLDALAVITEE